MLKGINPFLNAEVLGALRAMGHGDDVIIADTNFPADSVARHTALGKLLRIDLPARDVADAVLSVFPIDSVEPDAAGRMEVMGASDEMPPVHQEVQTVVDGHNGAPLPVVPIERFAFYERAKNAYAVIQTGERRYFGCFVFRKGVIPPEGE